MLVHYDVKDRSGAERAADAEPLGSDRERIHKLITGGLLGFTFEEDTESVYATRMPTNRIGEMASAIRAALPNHRPETKLVIAFGDVNGTTPTIGRVEVFPGNAPARR